MSRIQLPECYILAKHWKNDDDITTCWHNVIVKFFWCCFVSLVKLSYWSKFYANIITFSGVMTIFFYKGLTRNPEIGNTPVWVLPSIRRLGQVRDTRFGTNSLITCYWMLQNTRVTAFTVSELLMENQQGGLSPPSRLGLRLMKTVSTSLF